MANTRVCPRGDNCRFSHDPTILDAARKSQALGAEDKEIFMMDGGAAPYVPSKRLLEAHGLTFREPETVIVNMVHLVDMSCDVAADNNTSNSIGEGQEVEVHPSNSPSQDDFQECADSRAECEHVPNLMESDEQCVDVPRTPSPECAVVPSTPSAAEISESNEDHYPGTLYLSVFTAVRAMQSEQKTDVVDTVDEVSVPRPRRLAHPSGVKREGEPSCYFRFYWTSSPRRRSICTAEYS